jgi:hypothetical protein|tara:strand:+ start:3225 stop:3638 length:414 start_codon:yes stop_codon:yes gene_type:complete
MIDVKHVERHTFEIALVSATPHVGTSFTDIEIPIDLGHDAFSTLTSRVKTHPVIPMRLWPIIPNFFPQLTSHHPPKSWEIGSAKHTHGVLSMSREAVIIPSRNTPKALIPYKKNSSLLEKRQKIRAEQHVIFNDYDM